MTNYCPALLLDCFCVFVGMGNIYYSLVTLSIAWLLDFVSTTPYIVICTVIVGWVRGNLSVYKECFNKIFFFYAPPYEAGDLIELYYGSNLPSETCTRFRPERIMRVEKIRTLTTWVSSLEDGRWTCLSNDLLTDRQTLVWSRVPVVFRVMMQATADAADGLLFLRELHAVIKRFASENSEEWYPVETFAEDAVIIETGYKEYCFDIRHRETWQEFDHIIRSKIDLDVYCCNQADKFYRSRAKQDGVALPNVVEEKNNDSGDGNGEMTDNTEGSNEMQGHRVLYYRIVVK